MKPHTWTYRAATPCALAFVALAFAPSAGAAIQVEEAWSSSVPLQERFVLKHQAVAFPGGGVLTVVRSHDDPAAPTPISGTTLNVSRITANGEILWSFIQPIGISQPFTHAHGDRPVDVDSGGNSYVTLDRGAGVRLVKLSPNGNQLWDVPVIAPGLTSLTVSSVVVDAMDRPIVGGSVEVGTYPLIALFQFDPSGALLSSTGAVTRGFMTGMKLGPSGEVALYGRDDFLVSGGSGDGLIQVYDLNGAPQWSARVPSSTALDSIGDIAFDEQGELWAFKHADVGLGPSPDEGFILTRYSTAGVVLFRTTIATGLRTEARRIAVDSAQNVYVAGAEALPSDPNEVQASLWKVDGLGNVLWQARDVVPHTGFSAFTAVGVTLQDQVFVTGRWSNGQRATDALYDEAGNVLWRRERAGAGLPFAWSPTSPLPSDAVLIGTNGQVYGMHPAASRVELSHFVSGQRIGTPFCGSLIPNSVGRFAQIEAIGSDVADERNVTLRMSNLPPGTFAFAINGSQTAQAPAGGGGQGRICVGGAIGRHIGPGEIRRTTSGGTTSLRLDMDSLPNGATFQSAMAGQVWHFQCWYRDANPMLTSNLTNAVTLSFR